MEISKNCLRVQVILLFGIFLSLVSCQHRESYRVPQPTARILSPRGFRISIPRKLQHLNHLIFISLEKPNSKEASVVLCETLAHIVDSEGS